jgi:hypothetical protein
MSVGFFLWSMTMFDGKVFGLCGKTIGALRRNVLTEVCPRLEEMGAVWTEKRTDNLVTVGNQELVHAIGVTAKKHISRVQVTDPESGAIREENRNLGWSVTIVELLPKLQMPETERQETFTVYIQRPGGKERYEQCQWVQILLENVPGGLRRTRVARTWENRDIVSV